MTEGRKEGEVTEGRGQDRYRGKGGRGIDIGQGRVADTEGREEGTVTEDKEEDSVIS